MSAPAQFHAERILNLTDISFTDAVVLGSQHASKKLFYKDFNPAEYRAKIKTMADELKQKIGDEKSPEKIIQAFNQYIFVDQKFKYDFSDPYVLNPRNAVLSSVLDRKMGNCLGLSILYLCLADELNVPLAGVPVPEHFFVRYDTPDKVFNIETTANGVVLPDSYYVKNYHVPPGDRVSLKTLSRKDTIAVYLGNVAVFFSVNGELNDEAINLAQQVGARGKIESQIVGAQALSWVGKGDAAKALAVFDRFRSDDPETLLYKGQVYLLLNDPGKAIETLKKSVSLRPHSWMGRLLLGIAYLGKNMEKEAAGEFQTVYALKGQSKIVNLAIGNFCIQFKQYDYAIRALNGIPVKDSAYGKAQLLLSKLYTVKEDYAKALLHAEDALRHGEAVSMDYLLALEAEQR